MKNDYRTMSWKMRWLSGYAKQIHGMFVCGLVFLSGSVPGVATAFSAQSAGFLRVSLPAGEAVAVSFPFGVADHRVAAILAGQLTGGTTAENADHVFKWDASRQSYSVAFKSADGTWLEQQDGMALPSGMVLLPGDGIFIQNRQAFEQEVVFAGAQVAAESVSTRIEHGLNLIAYPFSAGVQLNATRLALSGALADDEEQLSSKVLDPATGGGSILDPSGTDVGVWEQAGSGHPATGLAAGKAYWFKHAGSAFEWIENRPYAILAGVDGGPAIRSILAAVDQVTLTIDVSALPAGSLVSVYSRDLQDMDDWQHAGSVRVGADTTVQWHDNDAGDGRVYAVAAGRGAQAESSGTLKGGDRHWRPGQILVKPRAGVSSAEMEMILARHGGRQHDIISRIGVRVVRVPEDKVEHVVAALNRNPRIAFAEVDELVELASTPNDPYYGSQWHLPTIDAPEAWSITTGSSQVIVAIADTGVDSDHPDLAPLMVPGWNFFDSNSDTRDVHGHGTSVAGAAVAAGNNGIGIASVAWHCRIMPLRVSSLTGGATLSRIAQAITWAADNGARVVNVSYNAGRSSTVQSAAKYMQDTAAGVVTLSSGNDGQYVDAPNNPHVLVVGATTSSDTLASFSNRGPYVDMTAPGSGIYTTANGGGYRSASGTSFSAPIVAGVAALVISANPALSASEIHELLFLYADDLGPAGYDTSFGHGRVNAGRTVSEASVTPPPPDDPIDDPVNDPPVDDPIGTTPDDPPADPPVDTTPPLVEILSPNDGDVVKRKVIVDVTARDDESGVVQVELFANGELIGSSAARDDGSYSFNWNTNRLRSGSYRLEARATDATGNVGVSATVTVSI